MQKSIIVNAFWNIDGLWEDNTENLNELLSQGYKVVSTAPMGAFGYGYSGHGGDFKYHSNSVNGFAALVIVEKIEKE